MERIAIIDHEHHRLFIQDISDEDLKKYNGEEEAFIKDMYADLEEGKWSWDYIISIEHFAEEESDPVTVDLDNQKFLK